jgi:hypothetical protein
MIVDEYDWILICVGVVYVLLCAAAASRLLGCYSSHDSAVPGYIRRLLSCLWIPYVGHFCAVVALFPVFGMFKIVDFPEAERCSVFVVSSAVWGAVQAVMWWNRAVKWSIPQKAVIGAFAVSALGWLGFILLLSLPRIVLWDISTERVWP